MQESIQCVGVVRNFDGKGGAKLKKVVAWFWWRFSAT